MVSWIQSHFPPERTRRILGGMRGVRANAVGALLGTLTPFCSCSSIPFFIGFTSAGLPLGVTFSFLISSPLVDLASMVLLASVFNWTAHGHHCFERAIDEVAERVRKRRLRWRRPVLRIVFAAKVVTEFVGECIGDDRARLRNYVVGESIECRSDSAAWRRSRQRAARPLHERHATNTECHVAVDQNADYIGTRRSAFSLDVRAVSRCIVARDVRNAIG